LPRHDTRDRAARNEGVDLTAEQRIGLDEAREVERGVARRRAGQRDVCGEAVACRG
jgi:hypothetical protein